jgi:shikimate dehydrogenase
MISGETKVFAVIGDPVAHSLSPLMHNGWFEDHGIDAVYVALNLKAPEPGGVFAQLDALGIAGANITIPFKEAAHIAVPPLHPARAAIYGAANVFVRDGAGRLRSENTDGDGFVEGLQAVAHLRAAGGQNIVMLGAGGAARAIAVALTKRLCLDDPFDQQSGPAFTFVNRTQARAQELCEAVDAVGARSSRVIDWESAERDLATADIIINATSLGMKGQPALELSLKRAREDCVIADAVYVPLETPLLREARLRGLRRMDGLTMLINQGALAFELWFGVKPDRAKARARLEAALKAREEGA